ncbi:hypothetical protein CDEF62S_05678 [Castellaniella defragrans]
MRHRCPQARAQRGAQAERHGVETRHQADAAGEGILDDRGYQYHAHADAGAGEQQAGMHAKEAQPAAQPNAQGHNHQRPHDQAAHRKDTQQPGGQQTEEAEVQGRQGNQQARRAGRQAQACADVVEHRPDGGQHRAHVQPCQQDCKQQQDKPSVASRSESRHRPPHRTAGSCPRWPSHAACARPLQPVVRLGGAAPPCSPRSPSARHETRSSACESFRRPRRTASAYSFAISDSISGFSVTYPGRWRTPPPLARPLLL